MRKLEADFADSRNKLRSRPALMSPPTNAFASALELPPGIPAESAYAQRQGYQENLAAPYGNLSQAESAAPPPGKQKTLPRRRVLPAKQGGQNRPGSGTKSDASSSSSSSSPASDASLPPQRTSAGQGMRAAAPEATAPRAAVLRAAPQPRAEVYFSSFWVFFFTLMLVYCKPPRCHVHHSVFSGVQRVELQPSKPSTQKDMYCLTGFSVQCECLWLMALGL